MNTLGLVWTDKFGTWETEHFTIGSRLDHNLTVAKCYLNHINNGFRLSIEVTRYQSDSRGTSQNSHAIIAGSNPAHTKIPADVSAFVCWMLDENALKICPEVVAHLFRLMMQSNPGLLSEVA